MSLQVEDIVRDSIGNGQIKGFVFSFDGERVSANINSRGNGVSFCYIPKTPEVDPIIADRVKYDWKFDFEVYKVAFWRVLNPNGAGPKEIERGWAIYSLGLDQYASWHGPDLDTFREARDYLAKRIRKGLKGSGVRSGA